MYKNVLMENFLESLEPYLSELKALGDEHVCIEVNEEDTTCQEVVKLTKLLDKYKHAHLHIVFYKNNLEKGSAEARLEKRFRYVKRDIRKVYTHALAIKFKYAVGGINMAGLVYKRFSEVEPILESNIRNQHTETNHAKLVALYNKLVLSNDWIIRHTQEYRFEKAVMSYLCTLGYEEAKVVHEKLMNLLVH